MRPTSLLLLPPKQLSSCLAAAIIRDTRGAALSEADRFNCFPATPLVCMTQTVEGEIRMIDALGDVKAAQKTSPKPSLFVMYPNDRPTIGWCPAEVYTITLGFYPEAWVKLGAVSKDDAIPEDLAGHVQRFADNQDPRSGWDVFCKTLAPLWEAKRNAGGMPDWSGSDLLSDWSRHLFSRIAMTTPGRSIRTIERRIKHWTGSSVQQLNRYLAIEEIHRHMVKDPAGSLADMANHAGFSDQSHMGRTVRRTTGFSPAKLNRLIQTEEAFWCYRLLGERF